VPSGSAATHRFVKGPLRSAYLAQRQNAFAANAVLFAQWMIRTSSCGDRGASGVALTAPPEVPDALSTPDASEN
jgi:hypothetical protein